MLFRSSLQDEDGKVRARIGLTAEGAPILRLLNADGELRGIIGLTTDGVPVMQFLDAKGNPMLTIPERLPESDAADEGL